jgi:hypothetical protein
MQPKLFPVFVLAICLAHTIGVYETLPQIDKKIEFPSSSLTKADHKKSISSFK